MWPKLSNIRVNIANTIKSYANNNVEASKLNAWIRVFSGANSGLILQSNTNFKLFAAAGEASIYGNSERSGTIGRTWGTGTVVADVGRVLRPSPVITSFSSKEGQDQISRTCEFSIMCFSKQQLEKIQTYFMEPGFSVAVEWGWNTERGTGGLVSTGGGAGAILNQIADATLNNDSIDAKRSNANGEYDIFLGFIIGSTVTNEGENFKVDVKLRGAPSLPTYLQTHNKIQVVKSGITPDPDKSKQLYKESELLAEGAAANSDSSAEEPVAVRERRFKTMFNDLPAFRQTESVKSLKDTVTKHDFVNFDRTITKKIDEFVTQKKYIFFEETVQVSVEGGTIDVSKEKLFSPNKYIRFELAVNILNKMGEVDSYVIGDKKVSFNLNINDTVIGAFPMMFSTKASKLAIIGLVPFFTKAYFLNPGEVGQYKNGNLSFSSGGSSYLATPLMAKGEKAHMFPKSSPLDGKNGYKARRYYWGYLKDLYVNFDMFKSKVEQKNKNIREILEDILNEMSSAVNSFWNFQIVEGTDANGDIIITVIDENFIGENPNGPPLTFIHSGVGSPFLNSSLDISIPADMAGKIINSRLGTDSQPDMQNITIGNLFSAEKDLFLQKRLSDEQAQTAAAEKAAADEKTAKIEKVRARIAELKAKTDRTNADDVELSNKQVELGILDPSAAAPDPNAASSTLSANIAKLDIVPRPTVTSIPTLGADTIGDVVRGKVAADKATTSIFCSYCFDDTDFFDKIKNYWFKNGAGPRGLSQPLPIKYSFTILGNSGIRRGDTFNIVGIPDKYAQNGLFQVSGVEHSISGMRWETTIEGIYRQNQ